MSAARAEFVLTLDLGNQRAKLARWNLASGAPKLVDAHASEHGSCSIPADARWSAAQFVASNVASEGVLARWRAWGERLGLALEVPAPSLETRVAEPDSVGCDRLLAAAGALVGREAAVVVNLGTALTVDAAADGAFLGGAIGISADLAARALHAHTARLPAIEPRPTASVLGGDTEAALQAGVVLGLRGAAAALVTAAAREAGFADDVPVVVTGGGRALLLEPEPFCERPLVVEPQLVHLGLLAAAGVLVP